MFDKSENDIITKCAVTREFSLSQRNISWIYEDVDDDVVNKISQGYSLSFVMARLLALRKIPYSDIERFLSPKIKYSLPDPYILKDMEKGVKRTVDAIYKKEKIGIFGDYDVDGATSSALLSKYFRLLGLEVIVYIPDRLKEGYGPNKKALTYLKNKGVTLCITVDCGTSSCEVLEDLFCPDFNIIVVDHHISMDILPKISAVINPNRVDETDNGCKLLAAVGVSFLLLVAINRELCNKGMKKSELPDLMQFLDLVALGTVCDVMKLEGLNRAFVYKGLQQINNNHNGVIYRLIKTVNPYTTNVESYHLGFVVGPRINAGGRVGDASLGNKLLSTDDEMEQRELICTLEEYNCQRKAIEKEALDEAIYKIENEISHNIKDFIMVGGNWHIGVIGIIASRLKEKYNLPVAVVSWNDECGTASARSIKGLDIGKMVLSAYEEGLIIKGGGHAMAAGFSIKRECYNDLYNFYNNYIVKLSDKIQEEKKVIDLVVYLNDITPAMVTEINTLAPFGVGNRIPRILLQNVMILDIALLGKEEKYRTIKCLLLDKCDNIRMNAIAFYSVGTEILEYIQFSAKTNKSVSIIGTIKQERGLLFVIEDIIDQVNISE